MISRRDERLFRQAAVMATLSQVHVRVGVVLAKGRRPFAFEHNVSGPVPGEPYHEGHAEARAIDKVVIPPRSTIYVARIDRAGTLMPSMPCNSCWNTIGFSGVRRVVYYDGTQIKAALWGGGRRE